MRTRPILSRALIHLILISILWLATPTTPFSLAAAPDYSGLEPANPYASEDARKVLNYLAGLPDQGNDRVISGQNISHNINSAASGYNNHVVSLYNATDKWVGLVGADYGSGASLTEITTGNQTLIDYWDNGGLVTISNHANNPWTGGSSHDVTIRDFEELITPGTPVYDVWMAELDKLAAGLAQLRDAGVVVLWRPFHEMTFNRTFWWDIGAHPGDPEPFKDMWRHMFNYFTYEKGLNNLLWVYSTANSDTWNRVDIAYPGDEYVDIVGIDVYSDGVEIRGDGYSRMLAIGKPFALTEVGPQTRDGSYDNMILINTIKSRYPKTTYFLTWHSWTDNAVAIVDNRNAAPLLNDPWVITRDELDWWSQPASEEMVIDNTDVRFSTNHAQGSWQQYTQSGGQHYADSHHYNVESGTGQDQAIWSFTVPKPGYYDMYAWWWAGDWRPSDVPYTVNHYGGATTVRMNQRLDGGQWNLLGTYYLEDMGSVVMSDDVASGQDIVADAIKLVYSLGTRLPVRLRLLQQHHHQLARPHEHLPSRQFRPIHRPLCQPTRQRRLRLRRRLKHLRRHRLRRVRSHLH